MNLLANSKLETKKAMNLLANSKLKSYKLLEARS
jgi:hypothetical protein